MSKTITEKMNGNKFKLGFIKSTVFPDDTKDIKQWREKNKIGTGNFSKWCKEFNVSHNSITKEERQQYFEGLNL